MVLDHVEKMGSGLLTVAVGLVAMWILWKVIQRRRILRQLKGARITPEELRDRIQAGEDLCIVDLRGPEEKENSVPGAVRISVRDLKSNQAHLPVDREIILFCSCPDESTSASLAILLRSKGVTRIRPLQGGAAAWGKMMQLSQ
jgi:rhodanese-related sulfurtransferase